MISVNLSEGDYLVHTNQPGIKYILETLGRSDRFFLQLELFWCNFRAKRVFFSVYFEDTASELLNNSEDLRKRFNDKKTSDKKFAEDGAAQLDWVYKNSDYFWGKNVQKISYLSNFKLKKERFCGNVFSIFLEVLFFKAYSALAMAFFSFQSMYFFLKFSS